LSEQANTLTEILKQFKLKSVSGAGDLSSLASLPPDVLAAIKSLIAGGAAAAKALPAPKASKKKSGSANDVIPLDDFGTDTGRY
jgi:hypothetical protein